MVNRKTIYILIMVLMIVFMAFNVASADDDESTVDVNSNNVKSTVESYADQGGAVIEDEINKIGTQLIDLARGIFITLAFFRFFIVNCWCWSSILHF